jgi:hypothetical protein
VKQAGAKAKPTAAAPKPKSSTPKATATATDGKKIGFTQDDIALRAYFLAEKRRTLGLPGDEHTDWIEAERQLKAESKGGRKSKNA